MFKEIELSSCLVVMKYHFVCSVNTRSRFSLAVIMLFIFPLSMVAMYLQLFHPENCEIIDSNFIGAFSVLSVVFLHSMGFTAKQELY